jgi:glycosyltransferase involved in cell wall biosynthesis
MTVSLLPNRDPLVTIAIPTFNRASWLKDCVFSTLSQTYQCFEVVVSDNASTDETQEVLRQFNDRRLRVVRQKDNIGLLPNWNACLAEAKGEYIVFVPDDDRIPPWMVARFVEVAMTEPGVPIVIGLSENLLVAQGVVRRPPNSQRLATGLHHGLDVLEEFLKHKLPTTMCSIMIRAEALRSTGGFPVDVPYAGDMMAFSRVLFAGSAGLINDWCGTFSVHEEGLTSRLTIDELLSDWWTFSDRVVSLAHRFVANPRRRRQLSSEAKRFFTYKAVVVLRDHLFSGGLPADVLPLIWRWRWDLGRYGMSHIHLLARPFALVFLPAPVTSWIRRFKRMVRRLKQTGIIALSSRGCGNSARTGGH